MLKQDHLLSKTLQMIFLYLILDFISFCTFKLERVEAFVVGRFQDTRKTLDNSFIQRPCRTFLHALAPHQPFTQVISDVDDTIKSSGGVKIGDVALGGIDTQYDRGEMYPGVFEFILQLSMHSLPKHLVTSEDSAIQSARIQPAKVAILTARAEEFKVALELKDDSKLGRALLETGLKSAGLQSWGLGPVLYGSVAEWVIQDRKGLRKFTNFERLLQQDPSGQLMQYIYMGDTGELDQEAGEAMCREYPEVVKAVFLHVVSETPYPPVPPPKLINGRPVVFFRTYVGAAAKATQLNLMSYSGLLKVCQAASEALKDVDQEDSKWVELERDLEEASQTMGLTKRVFEIELRKDDPFFSWQSQAST